MWLLRFQNIKSSDYNKITRLCKKSGFCPKKFSATILVKGILIHILLKKSWRKISAQIGVPYLPIYQFYNKIKDKPELIDMLNYFCEKKVISYIGNEKNINRFFLDSDELVLKSLEEIKKL
ncbi:MAG: hypothetical protein Q9M94_06560 [Candidatus Gracilibacteria bacterium]|nr:hypothetical protein [Candidatus Gracilibacteria bacterium]MDQ7022970.1 hypothetical protein [Candidatus Gracilibacteria bacterium]